MTDHDTTELRMPLLAQVVKFGAVGAAGFVVNLAVFNALRMTVFEPAVLANGPLYATIVATVAAIGCNWLGNRYWAFAAHRRPNAVAEGAEFLAASLAGMLVPLLCLWVSHYLLGFTSLLADNIANNAVGLVLGSLFRFALYRWWVFAPGRRRSREARTASALPLIPEAPASASAPDGGFVVEG